MNRTAYLAYGLLALALAAWGAVIYAGYAIEGVATARAESINAAQQSADQAAYAARIHSLAGETALERTQLEMVINTDIVSIVAALEGAGKGVGAKVTTALPEAGSADLPGGGQLHAVSFVVNAAGSYSDLMHALSVYEHLPLPSHVEEVDLEKLEQAAKGPAWNMTVHIRILTSADIST